MDGYRDTKPLSHDFSNIQESPPVYKACPVQGGLPISQNTVICTQPTIVTAPAPTQPPSAVGPIVFSCVVFWLCCWPLGLVAFIFAIIASSSTDYRSAVSQLRVANILSGIGLACGIVVWIVVIVVYVMSTA